MQNTATHCNTLQHIASHCNTRQHTANRAVSYLLQHNATETLQHTATRCNTMQHTATHCNILHHTATHHNLSSELPFWRIFTDFKHTATHCNALQHTAPHCNTPQIEQRAAFLYWFYLKTFRRTPKRVSNSNVLQCVAMCCIVLQCAAVCCSTANCRYGGTASPDYFWNFSNELEFCSWDLRLVPSNKW